MLKGRVSLCDVFISVLSYSSWLISSKCLMMAASILVVRVTRGVFADEVVGGLDRMATRALSPNVV